MLLGNDPHIYPDAMLDAGVDGDAFLSAALYRCMDNLLTGRVLLVVTRCATAHAEIAAWCAMTGHELLSAWDEARESVFLIRKR